MKFLGLLGVGVSALVGLAPATAWACGGCFASPSESTVVTGHRMAFSTNATRTVLWDQFQYSGSASDFSWVLPVRPTAYIETASDAWFEALDSFTTTQIYAPQLSCASSSATNGGCGCGASSDSASAAGGNDSTPGVSVVHEGTVGPYETVTLKATDPNALGQWLGSHGYAIPSSIQPVIAAYLSEGYDFLALRLLPGKGVQEMTPVRVITPSGDSKLPLRMVAAGIGAYVNITLFVIGEGRFAMPDLPELQVGLSTLTWDFSSNTSNYADLRSAALAKNDGRTYLVTFAQPGAFYSTLPLPTFGTAQFVARGTNQYGGTSYFRLADLYFGQAAADRGNAPPNCSAATAGLEGTSEVTPASAPSFECGTDTDLAAAMIGMHPAKVWATRLEMRLPASALDKDCVITKSPQEGAVSSIHQAPKALNAPCPPATFTGSGTQGALFGSAFLAWALRRRRRKQEPK